MRDAEEFVDYARCTCIHLCEPKPPLDNWHHVVDPTCPLHQEAA